MNKVFYAIGDAFESFFTILPTLGRFMNIIFIVLGFIAFFIWMWYMDREAKRAETANQHKH